MRMRTKLAIFLAICAITFGTVLGLAVMMSIGFEWERLDTTPAYESVSKELLSPFQSIYIDQADADVKIIYSDAKFPVIQYMECEGVTYSVETSEEGELRVAVQDVRPWYQRFRIGFSFGTDSPTTVLYLPQGEYEVLQINTHSGDVTLTNGGAVTVGDTTYAGPLSFSSVEIETTSGDVVFDGELRESAAMHVESASGDITVKHVTAGSVSVHSTSGGLTLLDCKLPEFVAQTTSGDVTVTGVQATVGYANTHSGDVFCKQLYAGSLTLSTTSGEVELERTTASLTLNVTTTTGDVEAISCYAAEIRIESTSGDVDLYFDDGIDVMQAESVSGDVRLEPKKQDNRGEGDCYVKTVSGDIFISRPPLSLWFN